MCSSVKKVTAGILLSFLTFSEATAASLDQNQAIITPTTPDVHHVARDGNHEKFVGLYSC